MSQSPAVCACMYVGVGVLACVQAACVDGISSFSVWYQHSVVDATNSVVATQLLTWCFSGMLIQA